MQVRDTNNNNIKQRMLVRQPRLQKLLLETKDQEPVFISRTSTSEQIDRSDESNIIEDPQSSIGKCMP